MYLLFPRLNSIFQYTLETKGYGIYKQQLSDKFEMLDSLGKMYSMFWTFSPCPFQKLRLSPTFRRVFIFPNGGNIYLFRPFINFDGTPVVRCTIMPIFLLLSRNISYFLLQFGFLMIISQAIHPSWDVSENILKRKFMTNNDF